MRLVPWIPEYHEEYVRAWWQSRFGKDFPVGLLPETGYVAYVREQPIAALFLYETNSSLAWVAWPISDPESKKDERNVSLEALFAKLQEVARSKGFRSVLTTTGLPHVAARLEGLGYAKADEKITQYYKELE